MAITNFEVYATRLRDERLDVKLKQTIAHELCESLEFFQLQDYTRFVAILWPVIRDLLLKTPPVFVSSAPEQKLRSTLLDVIQRIPHSEVFRPVVLEVVTTLLALVKTENEENAVVCLKIIYELHRMYRQLLDGIALPFLDLAAEIYRNADQMLKVMDSLDTPAPLSTPNVNLMSPSAMSPGPDMGDMSTKNLSKATLSFKVLTEIPIIVVSIIQANRRHADPFVTNILPLILHMLELNPKGLIGHPETAQSQNQHWRSAHSDLITAQSKTLSFLAFFARGFTPLLIPFQDRIANLTLQLLCLCPAEATATRKEILIATRHIVSTDIRKAFLPIADKFLDMQVLVGSGLASQCILKPFAFSMLADLIHHIRLDLSPSQLTRMIDFYAGCMHDQSLSSGVHTMCAKLLHNITERIMLLPDKRHARILLLTILKTFTSSFAAIGNQAAAAISDIRSGGVHAEEKIYGVNELIRTNAFEQGDNIKELRFLLRSLVTGCKNVIYGLKRCDSMLAVGMDPRAQSTKAEGAETEGTTDTSGASMSIFSAASTQEAQLLGFELDLLSSLFREGLRACRIHDIERIRSEVASSATQGSAADVDDDGDGEATRSPALSREAQIKLVDREGKEQIEHFANLFINLDPAVFHELFTSQFDYAFQAMIDHCAAISSVQVFVASDPNSPAFISIMLRYLCDRLDLLGSDDEALTSTMLHLFKIAFLALALYPEANEPVLQPYVQTIINSALTISKAAKRPKNYFLLLRALFRSIGGGRYETLYKEVFPVLQNLLETLNSALGFTKLASSMQELFVEICLTVPVRLSVLLPYLSLLMKPLVFALESGPELVSQGLRTLELCIDNLTREFLDPILTPVMDEIMSSLWLHLRLPSSASTHAPVAARILGKLGGRNRHMLLTRFPVESGEQLDSGIGSGASEDKLSVSMTFEGLPGLVSMPLMDAVMFSVKVLEDRVPTKQLELARKDAVEFIVACSRYTLVLPFVADSQADSALEDAKSYSWQLIALTSDPLALKRLANISSPTAQGSQILERIIASCPSVGDTFKAGTPIVTNEAALTASNPTLSELCSDSVVASKSMPISHSGLMHVIWALSLASVHSGAARELLLSIISIGARQHIIQCVEAMSPELDSAQQDAKTHATSLASAVPEVISRVLVSRSRRLRATGTLMLRHFYTTLRELLSKKASLVGQLPAMRTIVSDLCAACYDPAIDTKHSGCVGIAFIVEELDLGRTWLAENLLELSKALLFTLKDTHSNVIPSTNPAESSATLMRIIKQAFPADIFAPPDGEGADTLEMDCEDVSVNDGVASDVLMSDSEPGQESNLDATFAATEIGPLQQGSFAEPPATLASDAMAVDGEVEGAAPTPTGAIAFEKPDNASTTGANGAIDRSSDTPDPNRNFASGDRTHAPDTEQAVADGSAAPSSAASVSTPAPAPAEMPDVDIAIDNDLTKSAADASEEPVFGAADAGAAASEADAVDKSRQEGMAAATQRAMLAFKRLLARLSPDNSRLLKSFLALITKELANPSNEVRDAAKACLDILVDVTGCSVTALLLPSRDRLLIPIFGKPLRALPHNMQIGNIDAITYCLSLDPPFLEINEELLRLLSEALALADAEDQALVNHPAQVRTNTMSLTHLRHVCIRMLTSAMVRPEFADAKNTPTRARIIS
ncbi:transcription-associated protein 1, partial [Kickxella alabastrina]